MAARMHPVMMTEEAPCALGPRLHVRADAALHHGRRGLPGRLARHRRWRVCHRWLHRHVYAAPPPWLPLPAFCFKPLCALCCTLPSALKSAWLEELVERRGCRCCCAVSFAATISTIAFAFYIQPIAMPMLREMPPGKLGYDVLAWSMRLVIMGASSRPSLPSHPCS